jgi:hypothetical protein
MMQVQLVMREVGMAEASLFVFEGFGPSVRAFYEALHEQVASLSTEPRALELRDIGMDRRPAQ